MSVLSRAKWVLVAMLGLWGCGEEASEATDERPVITDDQMSEGYSEAFANKDQIKADTLQCSGVVVPDRRGFEKRVALTFDDGPNPETTPLVLEVLRRHNAPGTFFVNAVSENDTARWALLQAMAADPLVTVGNHTYNHKQMNVQTEAEAVRQIDKISEMFEKVGIPHTFFRFPFGASNCMAAQLVRDRGYRITGWHIDSADWCFRSGGFCSPTTFAYVDDDLRHDMKGFVLKQVRAYNGGVVLFHDIHRYTAENLDGVLTALEAEGFTFTSLGDKATFPLLNGTTPPFVGDACQSDADCRFTVQGEAPYCHAAGFCTINCAGYCPDMAGKASTFCTADPEQMGIVGMCVRKTDESGACGDLPGTEVAHVDRFVGLSTAPASEAYVCYPKAPVEEPADPVEPATP